jgi:ComF family protein
MEALRYLLYFLVDIVFPPRITQLAVRAASIAAPLTLLEPRMLKIDDLVVITLLPYREALVQALIIEAKYENNYKAREILGKALSAYIKEWCVEHPERTARIVPLPLGKKRKKERGYNQVEAVARCAQRDIPFTLLPQALSRSRDTAPQTSLGREARKSNMIEAFIASTPLNPAYTYILLDDVLTTGATLSAAHDALEKAGATDILVLALAH